MGDEREAMIAKCYPNYSTTNTHTVYTQTHCKICHTLHTSPLNCIFRNHRRRHCVLMWCCCCCCGFPSRLPHTLLCGRS